MHLQTRLEIRVTYARPARDCRRVLRVLPLHRAGQTIIAEGWKCAPLADFALEKRDEIGNRRLLLKHRAIERELGFGLEIEAQTSGAPVLEFAPDRARWKRPSRLVVFTPELQKIARAAQEMPPLERAAHFASVCARHLEYDGQTGAETLSTPRIWARRKGNCADFAHVFLALCRASGLPARYVAGFSRSQGQMHAYAEVWDAGFWHPFDPTFSAARAVLHLAVAIGRDFSDCAPHGGQFRGAGEAQIEVWCSTRRLEAG